MEDTRDLHDFLGSEAFESFMRAPNPTGLPHPMAPKVYTLSALAKGSEYNQGSWLGLLKKTFGKTVRKNLLKIIAVEVMK